MINWIMWILFGKKPLKPIVTAGKNDDTVDSICAFFDDERQPWNKERDSDSPED